MKTKLQNIYIQNLKNDEKTNTENVPFLYILCETCFSTKLILKSFYNILLSTDKKGILI